MTEAASRVESRWRLPLIVIPTLIAAALLVVVGVRIGMAVFGPAATTSLPGELQQVETTGGTYLGRVTSDDGTYLRLAGPAIVLVESGGDGTNDQIVVRSLSAEPYGLGSVILLNRDQIIFVAGVASDSQLAAAYASALGN